MLSSTILIVLIGYVSLCLILFIFQRYLIFFPDKNIIYNPGQIGLIWEDITLTTEDEILINAWFIPADPSDQVVLFCHGNTGNISHRLESINFFHSMGLNVIIFDYRGFGKSSGNPDEEGTYRDAETVWHYLVNERGYKSDQIILFGRSLGSGIASWLARKYQPGAVILESSFTSLPDLGAQIYPFLPVRLLARYQYPTSENLKHIKAPVLIIHSREDEIIPFKLGEENFKLANQQKQFLEIHGSHNDGFLVSANIYESGIRKFLSK